MAIIKKSQKAEGQELPARFVELVQKAATYYSTAEFFTVLYGGTKEEKHGGVKGQIEEYLNKSDCPITVSVGAGGGVKVPGVATLSFSQPDRVDNGAAVQALIKALNAGTIRPDDLTEVISTVKKEGLIKVLPEQASSLIHTSDDVTVTIRSSSEFKEDVFARLRETVATAELHTAVAASIEVTAAQTPQTTKRGCKDEERAQA